MQAFTKFGCGCIGIRTHQPSEKPGHEKAFVLRPCDSATARPLECSFRDVEIEGSEPLNQEAAMFLLKNIKRYINIANAALNVREAKDTLENITLQIVH